jgi:hypothetical protein
VGRAHRRRRIALHLPRRNRGRYELPKQTDRDNVQDFLGYLGGIALGWIIVG